MRYYKFNSKPFISPFCPVFLTSRENVGEAEEVEKKEEEENEVGEKSRVRDLKYILMKAANLMKILLIKARVQPPSQWNE